MRSRSVLVAGAADTGWRAGVGATDTDCTAGVATAEPVLFSFRRLDGGWYAADCAAGVAVAEQE